MSIKQKVLEYLESKKYETPKRPTEIGMAIGKDYNSASASVSPALKKLVKEGLVKREVRLPGKVLYSFKFILLLLVSLCACRNSKPQEYYSKCQLPNSDYVLLYNGHYYKVGFVNGNDTTIVRYDFNDSYTDSCSAITYACLEYDHQIRINKKYKPVHP